MSNVQGITNPSFETGDLTGWDQNGGWYVSNTERGAYDGTYEAVHRSEGDWFLVNQNKVPVVPGMSIRASCWLSPSRGSDRGSVLIAWYDASGNPLGAPYTWGTPTYSWGTSVKGTGSYRQSTINTTVPPNARFMSIGVHIKQYTRSYFGLDKFEWNYVYDRKITLSSPQDGKTIQENTPIEFTVGVEGTSPPVEYLRLMRGTTLIHEFSAPPYTFTLLTPPLGVGVYTAVAGIPGGTTITSNPVTVTVQEAVVIETERREFNASNAYTYLVAHDFFGIRQTMPDTSNVTGIQIELNYSIDILAKTLDLQVGGPAESNPNAIFDIVPNGSLEFVFLRGGGNDFTKLGVPGFAPVAFDVTEYTVEEEAVTTDGMKWTVMEGPEQTATVGGEDFLFGLEAFSAQDITTDGVGLRFIPQLGSKPEYTGAGSAVFRVKINSIKVMVYFDSGSPIYYFASPDKSQVIKGTLVSSYALAGSYRTGDAQGVLQLLPELEVMDGSQTYIGPDWTIHAQYPPTDRNQIGDVQEREYGDGLGMAYNTLPTQFDIVENRSRYLFITTNFYGDKDWDSMYGVNGVDRAFAYNGEYFYNIYTQPDLEKDRPRHVANHHLHLALGYDQGRVDISVAGQPYNFNGAEGASTWAIGDQVVGLLPLSGMILGIFGNKSVHGLAGTTVDNFTTQVISAKRGAIEYTIADMGYPVYANSYGIYTLAQIQQYGDYAGTPMSDPVSPWFKDRLLRKNTSSKEVVCAWPVRTSNQYRLAFRDGYVVSMTMDDTKGYPTFSFLKYFITPPDENPNLGVALTDYPTIYPIAVSSELDDTGEERIHIANIEDVRPPTGTSVGW